MQRERPCLVIGCGKTCKFHPEKDWFSVDSVDSKKKPDLRIDYRYLKPEDYNGEDKKNNKVKLINNSKFNLIFFEQIAPSNVPSIARLKNLLNKDAALVFFGSQRADAWRYYAAADLKITSFVYSQHVLILTLENCSVHDVLEKVRCDLVEAGKPDTFIKLMNLVESEIKRLNKIAKYKCIDPILISVIAHLRAYVIDRNNRPWWSFFFPYAPKRNPLMDAAYAKFAIDVEKTIIEFGMFNISYEQMQEKIREWKSTFTSSYLGSEKVDYTKLSYLLGMCSDAIKFYAKAFDIEPRSEVKTGMRV